MFYPEAETGAKFFGIREIRTKAADGTESRLRQQSLSIQNIRVRAIEGGVLPDQDFQDYKHPTAFSVSLIPSSFIRISYFS